MTADKLGAKTGHMVEADVLQNQYAGSAELEDIAKRFGSVLERYFKKRLFDRQESEDLVQEVFCRLAARTETLRIENPEAYLFQIAANLLRDRARRDISRRVARQQFEQENRNDFDEISPERVVLGRQRMVELRNALHELPERTQAIFVLHRFEGFKYREIAKRLGISASLVEKHIMDAIGHLTLRMGRD